MTTRTRNPKPAPRTRASLMAALGDFDEIGPWEMVLTPAAADYIQWAANALGDRQHQGYAFLPETIRRDYLMQRYETGEATAEADCPALAGTMIAVEWLKFRADRDAPAGTPLWLPW